MGIHDWAKSLLNLTTQELDEALYVMSDEDWICEEYKSLLRSGGFRPYEMMYVAYRDLILPKFVEPTRPLPHGETLLKGMFKTVQHFFWPKPGSINSDSLWFWVADDLGVVFRKCQHQKFTWNAPDEDRIEVTTKLIEELYKQHTLPREVVDRFWKVNPVPYIIENKIVPNVMGPFADELTAWTALLCAVNNEEVEKSNDKLRDQDDAETGTGDEAPSTTLAEELHPWTGW